MEAKHVSTFKVLITTEADNILILYVFQIHVWLDSSCNILLFKSCEMPSPIFNENNKKDNLEFFFYNFA